MIFQLAEVAPAAPLIVEALPPLIVLAGLIVALGLVMLLDGFVRGLFGAIASLFSHIPGVGGLTSDAIHGAEQAISNALGTAISGIEKRIAHQFHNLAHIVSHFWHLFEQSAVNMYEMAKLLAGAATFPDLHALERRLLHRIRADEHSSATALRHALHLAKAFAHSVAQGIYPRLRAVEHEVTRTIPKEIKSARALAREAEDRALAAGKTAEKALSNTTTAALTLALPAVIARLGWDWIKCREGRNVYDKRGCGMWSDLDDVLGLLALTVGAMEFETLVRTAQELTEEGIATFDDVFGLSR